jgi:holo-[acyl-carrier protein] synthase
VRTSPGIDLTSVDGVRNSVDVFGSRYLERVDTADELRQCGDDSRRLAAREVATIALSADAPVPWRSIGVSRNERGRPSLELSGAAAGFARCCGVGQISVSNTHESHLAAAIVRAEIV